MINDTVVITVVVVLATKYDCDVAYKHPILQWLFFSGWLSWKLLSVQDVFSNIFFWWSVVFVGQFVNVIAPFFWFYLMVVGEVRMFCVTVR